MLEYNMSVCDSPGCTFLKHTNPANNGGTHCCGRCKISPNDHGPRCQSRLNAHAFKHYVNAKTVKLAKAPTAAQPMALKLTWQLTATAACCVVSVTCKHLNVSRKDNAWTVEPVNGLYTINLDEAEEILAKGTKPIFAIFPYKDLAMNENKGAMFKVKLKNPFK